MPKESGEHTISCEESSFFQPHLTSDPPRKSVRARVCAYTLAGKGFRIFNCTLDVLQYMQHQATALLELTLYRAGESEAQFSAFSLRPSKAGGYSLQLAARLGEGNLLPSLNWQHRPNWHPAQSSRLPMALQGQASSVIKENYSKKRCKQSRFVSYFYMVSYHRRTHLRLLSH